MKFDLIIVGAGVSGVPAAVASARTGAKTLLLEQRDYSGGTLTASLGFPICGLFENDTSKPPRLLNGGLSAELFSTISKEVPDSVVAMGRLFVCRCPPALFESIYTEWIKAENLTVYYGIRDLSVTVQENRIELLTFRSADKALHESRAGQVIDSTGTGAVITLSGAEEIIPDHLPLIGFSMRLEGVQSDELLPIKVPYSLRKAVESGALPPHCAFTVFSREGSGLALCKFSLPPGTSREDAEQTARLSLAVLREQVSALRGAEAVTFSPAVLPREGTRMKGRMILTGDDVKKGRTFSDAVVRGAWPLEYWDMENGVQYNYVKKGGFYDIPLRALRSVNIQNLWAAGRALSADSAALASARVMGTAIATGEAAGRAAAGEVA